MKTFLFIWHNKLYDRNENEQIIKGGVEAYLCCLIKHLLSKGNKIDFVYLDDDREILSNKIDSIENEINFIKIETKKLNKKFKDFKKNKLINLFIHFYNFFIYYENENYKHKALNSFLKKNISSYDFIVNNVPYIFSKKIRNAKKMFFVQHTDISLYKRCFYFSKLKFKNFSLIYKFIFLFINKGLFFDRNCLKRYKNVVFFSNNKKYLKINKNALIGSIPLETIFFKIDKEICLKKMNNSIVYFGRFDNKSKNLDLLSSISKKGNLNIDLYGFGNYDLELKKNFLLHFKGRLKTNDTKIKILSKYDIFLLTSNYEGLPQAAIELLSIGVIGIIRNSFLEAKTMIPEEYHDLLLIHENSSEIKYVEKINLVKNLSKNEKDSIRMKLCLHIKNNFSLDKFLRNWDKILN